MSNICYITYQSFPSSKANTIQTMANLKYLIKNGNEVRIVGFGTFSVASRAATTGRNPRTGEAIQIAASKQPKFKAGAPLKAAVNN